MVEDKYQGEDKVGQVFHNLPLNGVDLMINKNYIGIWTNKKVL